MTQHCRTLAHTVVVEHLCRKRYTCYRCLQLVSHVVDKVVLYLGVSLLPEYHYDGEDEGDEQHECEHHRGYHKAHTREDISVDVGEVDSHHTHLRRGVIAKEHLRICVGQSVLGIVWTAIHLPAVGCRNREVIWYVDTVVQQFSSYVLVEQLKVDALPQRFVARSIEYVIHHLVKQRLLIDVSVSHYLLQRLRSLVD